MRQNYGFYDQALLITAKDLINEYIATFKKIKRKCKLIWLVIFVIISLTTAITIMAVEYTPVIFKGNVFLFGISCSIICLLFSIYFYFESKSHYGHILTKELYILAKNSNNSYEVWQYFLNHKNKKTLTSIEAECMRFYKIRRLIEGGEDQRELTAHEKNARNIFNRYADIYKKRMSARKKMALLSHFIISIVCYYGIFEIAPKLIPDVTQVNISLTLFVILFVNFVLYTIWAWFNDQLVLKIAHQLNQSVTKAQVSGEFQKLIQTLKSASKYHHELMLTLHKIE